MRIIGGDLKGRLIEPPSGFRARPTTDFARESLFNILNNRFDFEVLSVLDLFSGTGAISYEFASRGTRDIDIVEIESRHCDFIRKTLGSLRISSAKVHRMSVQEWLKVCHKSYDIIFADPPYDISWLTDLPAMVMKSAASSVDTVFILEHPKSLDFRNYPSFTEHRNYGNVNFSFFLKT
ncbi:MAG TPA: RsmD family RNA methyltransferase [Bacteroidales bacterium]|nr:RsmD family RNA methyltransferase [Bacteroidales bacterium]